MILLFDQAEKLRQRVQSREKTDGARIIAIASGKGGVGKSNIAVNTALALKKNNKKVLLLDADLGMANIDVLLGLTAKYNLSHVLNEECSFEEAILEGPSDLEILAGTSGVEELLNINQKQVERLMRVTSQMEIRYDIIIIDIGAGIHSSNINFISVCDEVIVVLVPEPTAIMDGYSLIKILHNHQFTGDIGLVINQLSSQQEGKVITNRMKKVINDYLNIDVDLIGLIPFDYHLRQAVKKQNALLEIYPKSKSGQALLQAANNIMKLEKSSKISNNRGGFMNRLLKLLR